MKNAIMTTLTGLAVLVSAPPVLAEEVTGRVFARETAAPLDDALGLRLPAGFQATVFADGIGRARHIAVRDNGDVYVNLRLPGDGGSGSTVALRDTDGDGAADQIERFGEHFGTGIAIHDGHLYVSSRTEVFRYRLEPDVLVPQGEPELIVGGFPDQRAHAAKTLAFDGEGHLFVNQGVPSNACQVEIRTAGSPGRQPCDELDYTGIFRFSADTPDQDQLQDGLHFAKGLRHSVAIDWNPMVGELYIVNHGRDQLNTLWPDFYDNEDNAQLPAEEMHLLREGANAGWPYTYYDGRKGQRMVAPEYGGDGQTPAEDGLYQDPILAFPAHWAPNDLLFYTGDAFPDVFKGGAFIAFHGSWNRAPEPQGGYNVVFVPFDGAMPVGEWGVFADGFAGLPIPASPSVARYRPTGLAQGPDGALFITESVTGRIWKVTYQGTE